MPAIWRHSWAAALIFCHITSYLHSKTNLQTYTCYLQKVLQTPLWHPPPPKKRQYLRLRLLSTFLHCVQKGSELSIKGLKWHQTQNYWTPSSRTSGPDGKEFATSTKQPSIWSIRSQNKKVMLLLLEWKNVSCWSKHWNHEVKPNK